MHVNVGIALPNRMGGRPQLILVAKVKQKEGSRHKNAH